MIDSIKGKSGTTAVPVHLADAAKVSSHTTVFEVSRRRRAPFKNTEPQVLWQEQEVAHETAQGLAEVGVFQEYCKQHGLRLQRYRSLPEFHIQRARKQRAARRGELRSSGLSLEG